jgi:hypothetical protein
MRSRAGLLAGFGALGALASPDALAHGDMGLGPWIVAALSVPFAGLLAGFLVPLVWWKQPLSVRLMVSFIMTAVAFTLWLGLFWLAARYGGEPRHVDAATFVIPFLFVLPWAFPIGFWIWVRRQYKRP